MNYGDVVRFMPTDILNASTASNSVVDILKYSIGAAEIAFRERYATHFGEAFVPDSNVWRKLCEQ